MHKLRVTLQVSFPQDAFGLHLFHSETKKNRQIWPPTFHPDPRPPNQEVLVTRPWRINNTEELRQYIIHPLGSFSKTSPHCCSGGFLCLLEIRRGGGWGREEEEKDRGKKSEPPDNYLHQASVTLQSRPQPCARTPASMAAGSRHPRTPSHTPTTAGPAHGADNHVGGSGHNQSLLPPHPAIS